MIWRWTKSRPRATFVIRPQIATLRRTQSSSQGGASRRSAVDRKTPDHRQRNHGVSDPATSREGDGGARWAGSLTPWFVRCRQTQLESRAAYGAARSRRDLRRARTPTTTYKPFAALLLSCGGLRLASATALVKGTTSNSKVVPLVVPSCCAIRRRQPGKRDGGIDAGVGRIPHGRHAAPARPSACRIAQPRSPDHPPAARAGRAR
jgi:hypothetical protein